MVDKYAALKLENQICFPLYAAARQIVNAYNPFFKPLGITYAEYIVFMVLWEEDGIKVSDLGGRLYLGNSTLTPLLKRMEQDGYIVRKRSSEDERIVCLNLTEKGWQMRDKVITIPDKLGKRVTMSQEKLETLKDLLHELLELNEHHKGNKGNEGSKENKVTIHKDHKEQAL